MGHLDGRRLRGITQFSTEGIKNKRQIEPFPQWTAGAEWHARMLGVHIKCRYDIMYTCAYALLCIGYLYVYPCTGCSLCRRTFFYYYLRSYGMPTKRNNAFLNFFQVILTADLTFSEPTQHLFLDQDSDRIFFFSNLDT